jgi:hypothetical protein
MTDSRLLVPASEAARKLGVTRRTLRKRIEAGLVRSVKAFSRTYIPQREIDRIVNGEPSQISAPKPDTANPVSGESTKACETEQNGAGLAAKSPKERLDDLLEGYADFLAAYEAGDPDVLAQVAAAGSPEANTRAKEADGHANKVWREYRE